MAESRASRVLFLAERRHSVPEAPAPLALAWGSRAARPAAPPGPAVPLTGVTRPEPRLPHGDTGKLIRRTHT